MLAVGAQHLAHELRVARRLRRHLLAQPGRHRRRRAEEGGDQQIDLHPGERLQIDPGVVAAAAAPPGTANQQLRPRRGDDQDWRIDQLDRQALELVQGVVVGVLQVLADDDDRPPGRVLLEEAREHRARELGPLLRAPRERAAERALRQVEAQKSAQQRRQLEDPPVAEHLLELRAELQQASSGASSARPNRTRSRCAISAPRGASARAPTA